MPRRHPPRDRTGPAPRDWERDDARDAEYEARQRANCAAKARYGSQAEARAHALMHAGAGSPSAKRTSTYRCDICDGWHFTRG
ncbi:MAG: hypothetical protein J7513_13715 [Solirubrobacteraceae bacterium]|nr:hypothetical protein [Solirubrobacteraceae bacterium]